MPLTKKQWEASHRIIALHLCSVTRKHFHFSLGPREGSTTYMETEKIANIHRTNLQKEAVAVGWQCG